MMDILNQFVLGLVTVVVVMIIMMIVLFIIIPVYSAHKIEQENKHRDKILDERFIEWWPEWKVKLKQSFDTIPRPFRRGPLNEKQILILYALAQAGTGGLQFRELMDLWGDQSIGANQVKFRSDFWDLHPMIFGMKFDYTNKDNHKRIIELNEGSGGGAEYLIRHKII